jgi:outer membrane lipoprotein-sorting protein
MQAAGRRQKAVCWRFRSSCFLASLVSFFIACAPRPPILPTGAGAPFPEFKSAYDEATASCRAITTITASMAMSGKAGTMKLRGRIDAGFEAPARARLEGRAPFGKPVFILVADGTRGTLVLPREDRVLRDAPPDQIVEALAGVRLGPDALRTVVTGCGLTVAEPAGGRVFPNGWAAVSLAEGTVYLRKNADKWEVAAAASGPLTVTYGEYAAGRPSTIRLRGESQGANADLTLRLSDVEINTTLHPKVFEVDLPERAVPLTLEELRRAGPLGGGHEP